MFQQWTIVSTETEMPFSSLSTTLWNWQLLCQLRKFLNLILATVSTIIAPEVVILTTSGGTSTKISSQWRHFRVSVFITTHIQSGSLYWRPWDRFNITMLSFQYIPIVQIRGSEETRRLICTMDYNTTFVYWIRTQPRNRTCWAQTQDGPCMRQRTWLTLKVSVA